MKFTSKISAGLVGLSLLVAASAQDPVKFNVPGVSATPAQPAPAPLPAAAPAAAAKPAASKFTEAQVAEAYGWYMGAQMGLRQLDFTKEQVEALARGLVGSVSGAQPPFDAKEIGPEVEAFLAKKQEGFMQKLRFANLSEGAAFFTKLKENKNVTDLPSGLRYEILKPGSGVMAKPGQLVTMHYTGSLINGQVFDSSMQPRQQGGPVEPADIILDPSRVIPGMVEGLQKVGVGGKIKLYVPPSLAYGDAGSQVIPPAATLIFEVEIIAVKDAPKEATVPAPTGK
jgi:FKBP-type peptidyl-prolyl cis-trans isomerase